MGRFTLGKIIAITNQKGGVGKTTTAVNLSACVAEKGKRVLLVDIDPQGNTTSGPGVNKNKLEASVYDVLINDVDAAEAIRDTMIDGLKLLPSQVDLAGAEVELVNLLAREQRMKNALAPIRDQFDYIFVDCPPSLAQVHRGRCLGRQNVCVSRPGAPQLPDGQAPQRKAG